jgi:hypothetical protein
MYEKNESVVIDPAQVVRAGTLFGGAGCHVKVSLPAD